MRFFNEILALLLEFMISQRNVSTVSYPFE
jgi:hypothetical protein